MQKNINTHLVELQKSLLGIKANVKQESKKKLDMALQTLIKLNSKMNYTNTVAVMMTGKHEKQTINQLQAIHKGLAQQERTLVALNHTLQDLEIEASKIALLQNAPINLGQVSNLLGKTLSMLEQELEELQKLNKRLRENAKERLHKKLHGKPDEGPEQTPGPKPGMGA